jgi:hypothetical protein
VIVITAISDLADARAQLIEPEATQRFEVDSQGRASGETADRKRRPRGRVSAVGRASIRVKSRSRERRPTMRSGSRRDRQINHLAPGGVLAKDRLGAGARGRRTATWSAPARWWSTPPRAGPLIGRCRSARPGATGMRSVGRAGHQVAGEESSDSESTPTGMRSRCRRPGVRIARADTG